MKIKINKITGKHKNQFNINNFECPLTNIKLNGKNGAGKSLLLKWLWKHPNCFEGGKLKIVYMNQYPKLYIDESIDYNIELFVKNNLGSEVWSQFSVHYPVIEKSEKCSNLSGGQYQLLYILIFLTQQADVYLIDEPFSNLDVKVVAKVEEIIANIGGIKIIVSHDSRYSNYLQLELSEGSLWME